MMGRTGTVRSRFPFLEPVRTGLTAFHTTASLTVIMEKTDDHSLYYCRN